MYYDINEETAKRANEMNSFYEYNEGSATSDYQKAVDEVYRIAEAKKKTVSEFYHEKIDYYADLYAKKLAEWTNAMNACDASCPSALIAGYVPAKQKDRQNKRRDSLYEEYGRIEGIKRKIQSIGTGGVDLRDDHAREELEGKIKSLESESEMYKKVNKLYKKYGDINKVMEEYPEWKATLSVNSLRSLALDLGTFKKPYPSYALTSIRNKIKTAKQRLEDLNKLEEAKENPAEDIEFDGGTIVQNAELNRLQIIFDDIPDSDLRNELKHHGFHWSPSNQAWQRTLTRNAIYDAKNILNIK